MKAPDGTIDLIGNGLLLLSDITGIVKDNLPTRAERKVKVGLRRLKHKYKHADIDKYVRLNFDECTEERQQEIINAYHDILNR